MSEITKLIAIGAELKARILDDTTQLKQIEAELIAKLAPGKHATEDGRAGCNIIFPGPALKPDEAAVTTIQGLVPKDVFKTLFERHVTFKPAKAFRELAAALVNKPLLKKVLSLCEKDSTPYVKWG